MSFGRKMLEKYGWKEGMGLGKNEDGLTRPVSVFIKNDTIGLGYNPNWWETLYDSTVKKIPVVHRKEDKNQTNHRPKKIMKISKENAKCTRCVSESDLTSSDEDISPPRLTGKLRRIAEYDAKYLENLKQTMGS